MYLIYAFWFMVGVLLIGIWAYLNGCGVSVGIGMVIFSIILSNRKPSIPGDEETFNDGIGW